MVALNNSADRNDCIVYRDRQRDLWEFSSTPKSHPKRTSPQPDWKLGW